VPRFVPMTIFEMPIRPESSTSNTSSSSGFASQVSYDGGVRLPSTSVASSSSHGRSQQQQTEQEQTVVNHANAANVPVPAQAKYRGATNPQVQAPVPVRIIRNINFDEEAAQANSMSVHEMFPATPYTTAPIAYRSGPPFSAPQQQQPVSEPINGTDFAKVNISKNDRIYGNLLDNQPGNLTIRSHGNRFGNPPRNPPVNTNSRVYGNGNGMSNVNGNLSARTYANGITRRSRVSRVQSSPQSYTGGFNNGSAFAPGYPPNTYNGPQQYPVNRILFQGPPGNQVQAYRSEMPHQAQFPSPMTMFNAPPDPFAGPGRVRSAVIADYIRSGALDDGQSLDPDARTPTTGSDRHHRRRANSVQFSTPTRSGRNGQGNAASSSRQSSAMTAPSHNMRSAGSHTPTARTPASSRLLHGQTLTLPAWMYNICSQHPTLDEALKSLPFSNPYERAPAGGSGVVKFINIPYTTLRCELVAALSHNVHPVKMPQGSPYYAVHIVMDRNTGKTGDGYVEVSTARVALNTVRAINRRGTDGTRVLKIGNREVTVSVSTQEELMAALFPHATTVEWTGYTPRVIDIDTMFYPGIQGIGFTGFCGNEELAMLVKFAENPSRVSHSSIFVRHLC